MNRIYTQLAKQQSKLFKVNYAPEYKTFIPNYVTSDPSHPLHETQKRRLAERKKEGLWWHATTQVDLTKSSCVRSWARRRLRNAVIEELRARGYDENGKLIHGKTLKSGDDSSDVIKPDKQLDLKGSLRLHVQAPLIPAKFAEIRAEAGKVIEIMIEGTRAQDGVHDSVKRPPGRPQWNPPPHARSKKMPSTQQ